MPTSSILRGSIWSGQRRVFNHAYTQNAVLWPHEQHFAADIVRSGQAKCLGFSTCHVSIICRIFRDDWELLDVWSVFLSWTLCSSNFLWSSIDFELKATKYFSTLVILDLWSLWNSAMSCAHWITTGTSCFNEVFAVSSAMWLPSLCQDCHKSMQGKILSCALTLQISYFSFFHKRWMTCHKS